jgi:hypothetical protein
MFKNFRALEFPAINSLLKNFCARIHLLKIPYIIGWIWKIFWRTFFIIVYSFVGLLMLFLVGGLSYAGLLHLWKIL